MKKLQIALDFIHGQDAFNILEETAEFIDIIEIGTPLIIAEGSSIVGRIKKAYPDKEIFADIKVADGGGEVPLSVLNQGADIVSVLGVAEFNTIRTAIDLIHRYGAKAMIDLILISDLKNRIEMLKKLHPDIWSVHVAYDVQEESKSVIDMFEEICTEKELKAIAGGIKLDNFEKACKTTADIIIVGGGLCQVDNPRNVAEKMYKLIERYR